jgi:hypothetical protein
MNDETKLLTQKLDQEKRERREVEKKNCDLAQ